MDLFDMTVYVFRATVTSASGAVGSTSLDVRGGVCRQVIVQANTATTTFFANLKDANSLIIRDYGLQTGEFNDITAIPMAGKYTFNITNASPDDTFKLYFSVEE